jgi:lysophospholipase L1-like esterase
VRGRASKLLVGLGLLLLASLAGNVLLAVALETSFASLQFARIFPLGFLPDEAPRSTDVGHPSIAFWGDSRARSWAESAALRGRPVLNFAHGAQTSSQLLLQLQTAPSTHSDFAVVQIGINDLHPLGALPATREQVLARLRANIVAIRDLLLQRSDVVVMTTLFPPGQVPLQRRLDWDPQTSQYIRDINTAIRASADGKRVILLDAYELLVDADSRLAEGNADSDFFLHVNSAAYARLNEPLQRILAHSSR